MKHLLAGILVWVIWGLCSCQSDGKVIIPSPIYVDNHYHGPADPEITWNPKTEEWMIFYYCCPIKLDNNKNSVLDC